MIMTKKKLYLETHGCQMNVHDSEKAISILAESGYEATADPLDADLVLLNTCMVREKAARKVYTRIADIRNQLREVTPTRQLPLFGVMGCVAQSEAERLFERSRDVRLVIGTQSVGRLPELVGQIESGFPRAIDVRLTRDAEFVDLDAGARQTPHVAFVTITEGCNKFCSFCIVPFTRGRERSRRADNIVEETRALAREGYLEVHLLGQNVNSYGLSGRFHGSFPREGTPLPAAGEGEITFARLLDRVARESGLPRIKYTTSYPRDFDEEVLRVMDSHENLCEWIHLPAQSGSDRILRAMRRGYTAREYLAKIEAIRASQRDYAITGDIIVGFPGETEEDFARTLELVATTRYDGLYIFNYSPRPRTPAAAYEDSVPEPVKAERFLRLQELQRRVQKERYERYLDRTVEVLVEGRSARSAADLTGHTRTQKVVNFPGDPELIGRLVRVRITRANPNSLYGTLIRESL